jgi:hypothetical protein
VQEVSQEEECGNLVGNFGGDGGREGGQASPTKWVEAVGSPERRRTHRSTTCASQDGEEEGAIVSCESASKSRVL